MINTIRQDADNIIKNSISAVMPDLAVKRALKDFCFGEGRHLLIGIGKASWDMAKSAAEVLGNRLEEGIVITKYGHSKGNIPHCTIYEAGHPVPDDNSYKATKKAIDLIKDLKSEDTVIFLVSGGGSVLFEDTDVPKDDLAKLNNQLLACGADIVEINTIRKRLSRVKGGRFAKLCEPANVVSVVLSDILGDPIDMIASGPAYPDHTTCEQAEKIVEKYNLSLTPVMDELIRTETPKKLSNVKTIVTGSVRELCKAAAESCRNLGYEPFILTDRLACEAKEAGAFLSAMAYSHSDAERSIAFIAGGETIVHLTGNGMGGRNQELALASAIGISGLENVLIFSVGSDGTDGPTDAAGGMVDGYTVSRLTEKGISIHISLKENDSYSSLLASGDLVITGPTGTNVNDIAVVLIRGKNTIRT